MSNVYSYDIWVTRILLQNLKNLEKNYASWSEHFWQVINISLRYIMTDMTRGKLMMHYPILNLHLVHSTITTFKSKLKAGRGWGEGPVVHPSVYILLIETDNCTCSTVKRRLWCMPLHVCECDVHSLGWDSPRVTDSSRKPPVLRCRPLAGLINDTLSWSPFMWALPEGVV